MPSIELGAHEREAPRPRSRACAAYASAPTRVAWNRPAPATAMLPDSTSSPSRLCDRIGLAGEQRLVDLEPVARLARCRRPAPGRRRAARTDRRARRRRPRPRAASPSRTTRALGAESTASRSRVRLARHSCTMPMSVLNSRTKPKSASCPSPNTRISTNIVPRIALNRVSTFARTISPSVRLVRSSAALTLSAPLRDLARRSLRPAAAVESRCRALSLHDSATLTGTRRERYRDGSHDRGAATTCYRHPDRETGRHCTRCGRPACPDCLREASVGSQCVECVNGRPRPSDDRAHPPTLAAASRSIATKAIIALNVGAFIYIAIRDDAGRRPRRHWRPTSRSSARACTTASGTGRSRTRSCTSGCCTSSSTCSCCGIVGQMLEPGAGHAALRDDLRRVGARRAPPARSIVTPHAPTGRRIGRRRSASPRPRRSCMHRQRHALLGHGLRSLARPQPRARPSS